MIPPNPNVGWLFRDPVAAAKGLLQAQRHFPDHASRSAYGARTGRAASVAACGGDEGFRAVEDALWRSKRLSDTSATKVTLPFVEDNLIQSTRELMGEDWAYGLEPNRKALENFLQATIIRRACRRGS